MRRFYYPQNPENVTTSHFLEEHHPKRLPYCTCGLKDEAHFSLLATLSKTELLKA